MIQNHKGLPSGVLDSVTDPLIVYDNDLRILKVNEALTALYGKPADHLIGKHCFEFFHNRTTMCERCHVRQVFRDGKRHTEEKLISLPDGRIRHFQMHLYPMKDSEGSTVQVIKYARDVTEQKKLENRLRTSEERYHVLMEIAQEGIREVARQVNTIGSIKDLIHFVSKILLKFSPHSEPLFFILNPQGTHFLRLEECEPTVAEPLRRLLDRLEKSGFVPDFVQYLQEINDPQAALLKDCVKNLPFWEKIFEEYRDCFGLPIFAQRHCIGYFVFGSKTYGDYSEEERNFFRILFDQIADQLRRLVFYEAEADPFRHQTGARFSHAEIIGESKRMQEVYEWIDLVSCSDATVLITGENGTGKELVAQAIHRQSHRNKGTFVVANCSAYSPTLLESELFGHEKGAFTGAIRQKKGRIERAHGGTLFLDEIGEIAPATQILLLRFLQDHCFERVGGEKTIETNVRVLAATNRDLHDEVRGGRFRDDLYYRLNVISIHLPSLRERKEDIPLLCQHFLKKYNVKEKKKIHKFSSDAMQALMDYEWPGNVRQLENAVSHAVVLAQEEVIKRQHLPRFLKELSEDPKSTSLAENERRLILHVLTESKWNKHEAARRLRMSRSTLYSKIRRYALNENQCSVK